MNVNPNLFLQRWVFNHIDISFEHYFISLFEDIGQ